MESDSAGPVGSERQAVIFYDCCVPRNHIAAVIPQFPPAEHIFVREVFSPDVCNNDRELFAEVWGYSQQTYPGSLIFFVTVDQGFEEEIEGLEAVGKIRVIVMESPSCVSFENARLRVEAALRRVFGLV